MSNSGDARQALSEIASPHEGRVHGREVFVGRQPIFDRESGLFAYELLFRRGDQERAEVVDGDEATFTVMLNALLEIGLCRLVGNHRAFLNVTRNSVLCEYPQFFPQEQVVLEVLEDVQVDDELVAMVRQLAAQGYTIALDDFAEDKGMDRLLEFADIVKLDVREFSREQLERQVKRLRGWKLLAEKVETREEFDWCRKLGFDYFQGYYLCRPKVVAVKHVPTSQLSTLRLLARIYDPDVEPEEVIELIGQDVSLCYRLIRTVNSAQYGLATTVDSVGQAVRTLGIRRIRSWVTLLSISGMDDSPLELMVTAMVRARMCELLAERIRPGSAQQFFLVGLFSVLEGLIGSPMDELLNSLPLAPEIKEALLSGGGPAGEVLRCVTAYERGDFAAATMSTADASTVASIFLEAIAWADEARGTIGF